MLEDCLSLGCNNQALEDQCPGQFNYFPAHTHTPGSAHLLSPGLLSVFEEGNNQTVLNTEPLELDSGFLGLLFAYFIRQQAIFGRRLQEEQWNILTEELRNKIRQ